MAVISAVLIFIIASLVILLYGAALHPIPPEPAEIKPLKPAQIPFMLLSMFAFFGSFLLVFYLDIFLRPPLGTFPASLIFAGMMLATGSMAIPATGAVRNSNTVAQAFWDARVMWISAAALLGVGLLLEFVRGELPVGTFYVRAAIAVVPLILGLLSQWYKPLERW